MPLPVAGAGSADLSGESAAASSSEQVTLFASAENHGKGGGSQTAGCASEAVSLTIDHFSGRQRFAFRFMEDDFVRHSCRASVCDCGL